MFTWEDSPPTNLWSYQVSILMLEHDDVIIWKRTANHWLFVKGNHRSPVYSHQKRPVMWSFDVSLMLISVSKLLNKDKWFESSWYQCDIIVMYPLRMGYLPYKMTKKCYWKQIRYLSALIFLMTYHALQIMKDNCPSIRILAICKYSFNAGAGSHFLIIDTLLTNPFRFPKVPQRWLSARLHYLRY